MKAPVRDCDGGTAFHFRTSVDDDMVDGSRGRCHPAPPRKALLPVATLLAASKTEVLMP